MSIVLFIFVLAVASTAAAMIWFALTWVKPSLRHWSLFWAVGMITGVTTAILALLFSRLPISAPEILTLSWPISETLGLYGGSFNATVERMTRPVFEPRYGLAQLLVWTYLTGVMVKLVQLMAGRWRAFRIAKTATTSAQDIRLTDADLSCMTLTPFGRPRQSVIVMSEAFHDDLTPEQRHAVIAHEQAHIARRDDEVGLVLRIGLALCWFNPLMFMMFNRWQISAELQCDHMAMAGQSNQMRRTYAQTLLKALHITASRVRQYPAASLSPQHLRNEKMRIKWIMSGETPTFKRFGHVSALVITAAGMALTSALALSAPANAKPASEAVPETAHHFKIDGKLTSAYGKAKDPFKDGAYRNHHGVDFKAPKGTPIYAPAEGVVIEAADVFERSPAYGTVVIFQTAGGVQTMLAHLDSVDVKAGQQFAKGQKLAEIGSSGKSTGPHVHIETRLNGERVDPMSVWEFD